MPKAESAWGNLKQKVPPLAKLERAISIEGEVRAEGDL
jgi:hypothetical protein